MMKGIKFMKKYLPFIIGLVVLVLDQLTKSYIVQNYQLNEITTVIPNFFDIHYILNTGAAWSILEGQMNLFYVIHSFVIGYVIYLYYKEKNGPLWYHIGLMLLMFGAIGNFIDRITNNAVVDFFDFIIFGYDFPIFNIADMAIVIGAGLLIIKIIIEIIEEGKGKK